MIMAGSRFVQIRFHSFLSSLNCCGRSLLTNQNVGNNPVGLSKFKARHSRISVPKGYSSLSRRLSTVSVVSSGAEGRPNLEEVFRDAANVEETSGNSNLSNGRVMLIDGTSIIYRAYYKLLARLHHGLLTNADGNGDWVLTIFTALSLIIDVLEFTPSHVAGFNETLILSYKVKLTQSPPLMQFHHLFSNDSSPLPSREKANGGGRIAKPRPGRVIVVFDYNGNPFGPTSISSKESVHAKGLNFRHTLYPSYKSNRPPTPDTIVQGLQYLKTSVKAMSIKVIEVPGVEADDVIGTLAVRSVEDGFKVRVVSPDKDFFQILSPSLRLLRIAPRGLDMFSFGMEDFAKRYGDLKPSQFVDVVSLMGDKADNIPGVHGIGDVHAVQLITKFGTLENLLQCVDQIKQENIRKALVEEADHARLSKNLAMLRCDLPSYMVPFATRDLHFRKPEDNGEKFTSLLMAISAYAEGFSADPLIRRVLYLWKKLEQTQL